MRDGIDCQGIGAGRLPGLQRWHAGIGRNYAICSAVSTYSVVNAKHGEG